MANRDIKIEDTMVSPMELPDDTTKKTVKKSKAKTTKATVDDKTDVDVSKKSEKKNKKATTDSASKSATKSDSELVDKKSKQSKVKNKGKISGEIEKKPDTVEKPKTAKARKSTSKEASVTKSTDKKASEKKASTKPKAEKPKTEKPKAEKPKAEKPKEKSINLKKNKGMDLLVSFDTTGSMYPVLTQVRRNITEFIQDIVKSVNDVRIGIIAHGDYCDAGKPYTIRVLDLTKNIDDICEFVNSTDSTYGGDADECYELVLNTAGHVVSWDPDRDHIMVMIGDANPHDTSYPMNKDHLDWKLEADNLNKNNIKVFAVHALSYYRSSSKKFYEEVAKRTSGTYLTLDQFSEITNLILATCCSEYNVESLNEFIEVIRKSGKMTNSMARNINRLCGKEIIEGVINDYSPVTHHSTSKTRHTDSTLVQKDGLVPIAPGRFQTLEVDKDCSIREFVTNNGLKFKQGRAFYELSKSEKVQQYKEVIIQNKETGEMFNGAQVREYLGLQPQIVSGGVTERLNSHHTKEYRVFVQSTSVNRKLIGGTEMLYEVEDI